MFARRFTETAVSMLAVTLFSALLVAGCSDDDDGNGNDDIVGGGGSIATEMGWEWASCYEDEYDDEEWCDVIMFRPNGEMWWLDDDVYGGDYWVEIKVGEWSDLGGNRLHITPIDGVLWDEDDMTTFNYTLSNNGNTLTLWGDDYTKRPSHRPNGGGGNLVLPAGQAWTYSDYWENEHYGVIFRADGTVQGIEGFLGYIWIADDEEFERYSTSSGGILNAIEPDGSVSVRMNYTVSGNTLILGGEEYERTSDVVIFDGDNDALMVLCMSLVATGVVPSLELCMSVGDVIFNKRAEEVTPGKHSIFRRSQSLRALSRR